VATLNRENGCEGHSKTVLSVAFHPTAPLLATSSNDKTVRLWRLVTTPDGLISSATHVATLDHSNEGHLDNVISVAFHPEAPLLATGSGDTTVKLWRLVSTPDGLISSATCVATLDESNGGHSGSVYSVAFHPKAPLLATGSYDSTVKLWRLSSDNSSATCVATLDKSNGGHREIVTSIAFHPTAPLLATGSYDSTVKLWRLSSDNSSATCVATLDKSNGGHSKSVWSVAFHPWAPLLATGSSDYTIKLWRLSPDNLSVTCVATLDESNKGHSDHVFSVAFHPTAPLLATSSADNTVKLWKL
jgi:WD40 repeat protein